MPALYTTVNENQACAIDSPASCYTPAQHSQMGQLIHRGIQHLLSQQPGGQENTAGAAVNMTPSSWFG